ncbi:MAG: CbtB-domain containing protein [Amylibacter sp.]|nr:CbtB-domain containing protein [Amylibacter sp.]
MNTQAKVAVQTQTKTSTNMMVIAFAAFVGLGMITIAGHLQAAALHDAAHDVRHATGFPCH